MPRPTRLSGLYERVGGYEMCARLSRRFHERIEQDLVLRPLFPKDSSRLSEWFALFIGEQLGGPTTYAAKRGKQSLLCRHAHLSISTDEAQRWLGHMFAALSEVGIVEPANSRLRDYFIETAQTLTDPYLPLYDLPLSALRGKIIDEPALIGPSPAGHSLLRDAVCRWDTARVRFLLELGADANSEEPLGHGLLYRAANSQRPGSKADGGEVINVLIGHGAAINRHSGPGKSTPLHMAARRGHVVIAEILVKAGADLEARDSKGETPLRRAVNCRQEAIVRFLCLIGANPLSLDQRGRTPMDAARSESMRDALANPRG